MTQTRKNVAFRLAKEAGYKKPKESGKWRNFLEEATTIREFMKEFHVDKYPFDEEHMILYKMRYK